MKRFLLLIFLITQICFLRAGTINAWLDYAVFQHPEKGPYIETYLTLNASSLKLLPTKTGGYEGSVEVTILFKQADKVKAFTKTVINSPNYADTTKASRYFMDIQRFPLESGTYELEIQLTDLAITGSSQIVKEPVEIADFAKTAGISDIVIVESYTSASSESKLSKSGYDLIPNTFAFFPENSQSLRFYSEIYNTHIQPGENQGLLVSFYIEYFETKVILPAFVRHKRETGKPVIVLFADFNIASLGTGNYNLVVEIKDATQQTLAIKKAFFQRLNPSVIIKPDDYAAVNPENTFAWYITSLDTMKRYIKSLYPICTEMEKTFAFNQLAGNDLQLMQKFFYQFWYTRNAIDPHSEWRKYNEQVILANQQFSTPIKRGHETDRGRVFLMYGPPNTIAEAYNEPNSYPYEIWHYYKTNNNQTNRRFVFYLPDLVTNDFVLLHSDAIGEIQDPKWIIRLNRRNTGWESIDDTQMERHYGSRAEDLYNNPR